MENTSASLYIACREMEAARSFKEVAVIRNVKPKDIAQCYRLLFSGLNIKVPLPDSMRCIVRIANRVKASEKIKRQALDKMNDLMKTQMPAGKGPMGFAATVLYLFCLSNSEGITQKDLAEAAGVTEMTIRNRVRDLKNQFPSA